MQKKPVPTTLHEVKIAGRNFSKFASPSIFLDDATMTAFSTKGKDGQTRLQKLENGMAVRGLKHLYEQTVVVGKCKRLILCSGPTKLLQDDLFICLEEYTKAGQTTFLGLYRDTGLAVARGYLASALPTVFPKSSSKLTEDESKKASTHVEEVIERSATNSKGVGKIAKATKEALKKAVADKLELKKELSEVRSLLKTSRLAVYEQDLTELKLRMTKKYAETAGRGNWQTWFREHSWVLGPSYLTPIEKAKVGFDNIPDFLLPTLDGFADILELKLPGHDVVKKDPAHPGSFFWSSDAAKAIGQASNYINEAEDNRLKLKERIQDALGVELSFVKPRAFVIIGNETEWDTRTRRAFRNLQATLHGIEVLTYSDIVRHAEAIVKMLQEP